MADFKKRDFDDFVKRQQQELSASQSVKKFNARDELEYWLGRLNTLYSDIQGYLDEYIKQGHVKCEIGEIELREDFSGAYRAPMMRIEIGLKKVRVVPIGTMLIGSKGRVDVVGPTGSARLALINAKTRSPRQMIRVEIVDPTRPRQPDISDRQEPEWVWKFIGPSASATFTDLSKESFLEAILDVSNG